VAFDEVVRQMGGLHRFMQWDGPILTDSGGFQVFSLAQLRTVDEEGVEFQSHIDGSRRFFTPEIVMQIERNRVALVIMDIGMPRDVDPDVHRVDGILLYDSDADTPTPEPGRTD